MTVRTLSRAIPVLVAVLLLACAFPAGTPLPAVALAAAAAALLAGAAAPGRALPVAAFACCVSGSAGGAAHGLLPWPALAALAFAAGSALRGAVGPPREADLLDRAVARLVVFWAAAAAVSALAARTLWAVARNLAERVVNTRGTGDGEAFRGILLALAAAAAGLAFYDAARRAAPADRRRAVLAAVAGAAISGAFAWLQSRGVIAAARSPFWKTIGRFPGLQNDPNAAGVLAALAVGPAVAAALHGRRKAVWAAAAVALGAGIAASGSRSGVVVALTAVAAVLLLERRSPSRWARPAIALLAVAVTAALFFATRGQGGALARVLSILDRGTPLAYRTSSRGLFWRCAWDAFRSAPLGGIGWNGFAWRLPDLSAARGAATPVMDNPGNFYLQILCETGVAGALLFALFLRRAGRAVARAFAGDFVERGSAAALVGFAPALAVGSHLLSAEVSIAAFLMLALAAGNDVPAPRGAERRARLAAAGAAVAALAGWAALLAPTARADEAFRHSPFVGLYPPELENGAVFRWMRPGAAFRLGSGQARTLAFAGPDATPTALTIRAEDGRLFAGAIRDRPRALRFAAAARKPTVFLLRASRASRPSDSGAADSRLLSLRVLGAWP